MSRPRHPTVQTFTPGPSAAARDEMWEGIRRLFAFANRHRDDPSPGAQKVHRVLMQLSAASDRWYARDRETTQFDLPGVWPAYAVVAVANLAAIIRQRRPRLYVRRCPECRCWCLTTHKRRTRQCYRDECYRAAKTRCAQAWQRQEVAEEKKALNAIAKKKVTAR